MLQKGKVLTMDINMLRRALWVFLRPLITLITNLINPEIGAEWLEELNKFNRKEPCWTRKWYEKDGVIYFSVTSDGTTGPAWIKRLEGKGYNFSRYSKSVLNSTDFKPTSGVTTRVAVLKGVFWKRDADRTTQNIRVEGEGKRKWLKPDAEIACLIREMFTDEDIEAMGLWGIVAMHEPIEDVDRDPDLLAADRDGARYLRACLARPDDQWDRENGFAFRLASPANGGAS